MLSSPSFSLSPRGNVNSFIISKILSQLNDNFIFVDTTGITVDDTALKTLEKHKTVVCYSGIDWENTNCIDIRTDAHKIICSNSHNQIHIGNTNNQYFFSFWAEFIRQHPNYFLCDNYTHVPDIKKLYLCLNRKLHPHRVHLLDKLLEHNLLESGIISQGQDPIGKLLYKEIYYVDGEYGRPIPNDIYSLGDPDVWGQFFINVVTESCVHSDVFLSEKTWKPIIGLRPFLILGDNHLYAKLKELGFDTFDDIFGTWHQAPFWKDRAAGIVDVLKNLNDNENDLNKLYKDLYPRLLKNRNRFIEYMEENYNKICNLKLQ